MIEFVYAGILILFGVVGYFMKENFDRLRQIEENYSQLHEIFVKRDDFKDFKEDFRSFQQDIKIDLKHIASVVENLRQGK